ncbi:hypothetical protein [Rhodococcus pyridinivorans]|uniref:hypothetical protein n=1 Tax=Rhodococcus pyridinivorans TaxID=103816 RepID=UPI003AAA8CCA
MQDYYEEPDQVIVVDFNGNEITAHPGFPRCRDCGAEIRSGATVANADGVFHESCRW